MTANVEVKQVTPLHAQKIKLVFEGFSVRGLVNEANDNEYLLLGKVESFGVGGNTVDFSPNLLEQANDIPGYGVTKATSAHTREIHIEKDAQVEMLYLQLNQNGQISLYNFIRVS